MTKEITVPLIRLPHAGDLPLPDYATPGAAAVDLYAAVDADVVLPPMKRALIPTGLVMEIPEGYEGQIRMRSGLALKNGIILPNGPATIDSDYRGEVKVILLNLGEEALTVFRGMRIAQFLVHPVTRILWREEKELSKTERGEGGFASTNYK